MVIPFKKKDTGQLWLESKDGKRVTKLWEEIKKIVPEMTPAQFVAIRDLFEAD